MKKKFTAILLSLLAGALMLPFIANAEDGVALELPEEYVETQASTEQEMSLLEVEPAELGYLKFTVQDYEKTSTKLNGAQFVIKNPNASTTCGCGSSFSV